MAKNTPFVTLKGFSKESKQAVKDQYQRLKDAGNITGSFQKYLNNTGQVYFNTFFKELSKSAGKFPVNALLTKAGEESKKYFIK
jgi:phage-related protein